jgi:hypothetical protein
MPVSLLVLVIVSALELVKQGYNYTHGVTVVDGKPQTVSLLIPPADDAHEIVLAFEATGGEVAVTMTGASGTVAQWQGTCGELHVSRWLPAGGYSVVVSRA